MGGLHWTNYRVLFSGKNLRVPGFSSGNVESISTPPFTRPFHPLVSHCDPVRISIPSNPTQSSLPTTPLNPWFVEVCLSSLRFGFPQNDEVLLQLTSKSFTSLCMCSQEVRVAKSGDVSRNSIDESEGLRRSIAPITLQLDVHNRPRNEVDNICLIRWPPDPGRLRSSLQSLSGSQFRPWYQHWYC
jgi:hypothetical protein